MATLFVFHVLHEIPEQLGTCTVAFRGPRHDSCPVILVGYTTQEAGYLFIFRQPRVSRVSSHRHIEIEEILLAEGLIGILGRGRILLVWQVYRKVVRMGQILVDSGDRLLVNL